MARRIGGLADGATLLRVRIQLANPEFGGKLAVTSAARNSLIGSLFVEFRPCLTISVWVLSNTQGLKDLWPRNFIFNWILAPEYLYIGS